jgi:hypothetical protein
MPWWGWVLSALGVLGVTYIAATAVYARQLSQSWDRAWGMR